MFNKLIADIDNVQLERVSARVQQNKIEEIVTVLAIIFTAHSEYVPMALVVVLTTEIHRFRQTRHRLHVIRP